MKLGLIYLLLLFIFCSSLYAQNTREGETWQPSKNYYPLKFIGTDANKLYLAYGVNEKESSHIQHISIETIDTLNLKHISTKNFTNVFSDKFDFYPEDVQLKNGKLNFLGSSYDKKTKNNQLYRKVEIDSGVLSEKKLLWEYPSTYFESSSKKFKFSTNPKKDLILALGIQTGSADNSFIHFAIIDSKYKLVKQIHAPMDLKGKNISITQFSIDEPGNVQLLLQYQRSEDSLDLGFSLFAFPIMTEDIIEYQLDLPEKQITSIYFDLTENDHLKICGLYQSDFKVTDVSTGTFYMDIDRETGEVVHKSIIPFNASFLGNFAGETVKVSKDDFKHLKIISATSKKDGSLQLLAEQTQISNLCETDYRSGLVICKDEFKAENILIINFNNNATIDWFQWIYKNQHSYDDGGMFLSFNLIEQDRATFLLFNKSIEKKKQDDAIQSKTTTQIQVNDLNSSGQLEARIVSLSCKFPLVTNCRFSSTTSSHYYLRSDLSSSSILKISY